MKPPFKGVNLIAIILSLFNSVLKAVAVVIVDQEPIKARI